MTIDYERLKARQFPQVEHRYSTRDTILYALGVGLGADPTDERQLRFLYEEGLQALPTLANVLAIPGFWSREPDTGIDWVKIVHGEQAFRLHRPLPPEGTVTARTRITGIVDKGPGRGALIYSERDGVDAATGETLFTVRHTTFARGDGGYGGPSDETRPPHPRPEGPPALTCDLPTLPQAALIYRLSGDYNPLHADPRVAAAAGYPRPILHGLCTFGVAGHALLRTVCGYDPARLLGMQVRFTAPVFPGETIRTEMWPAADGVVSFRARVLERDAVVLDNGRADVAN